MASQAARGTRVADGPAVGPAGGPAVGPAGGPPSGPAGGVRGAGATPAGAVPATPTLGKAYSIIAGARSVPKVGPAGLQVLSSVSNVGTPRLATADDVSISGHSAASKQAVRSSHVPAATTTLASSGVDMLPQPCLSWTDTTTPRGQAGGASEGKLHWTGEHLLSFMRVWEEMEDILSKAAYPSLLQSDDDKEALATLVKRINGGSGGACTQQSKQAVRNGGGAGRGSPCAMYRGVAHAVHEVL
jgi:hypothetical protein